MDSIIFDIDGTLWDSTTSVAIAWNKAIQENSNLDLTVDEELLGKVFGKTMSEIGDILFPTLHGEEKKDLMKKCFTTENDYLSTHPGKIYDGVVETIKELANDFPLFIVSNCQTGYIETTMAAIGITPYIKDYLCFEDTHLPKGDNLKILIEKNHLKSPIYVGDTLGDEDACKVAQIPFVFAEYGFGNVPNASIKIETFPQLLQIIK